MIHENNNHALDSKQNSFLSRAWASMGHDRAEQEKTGQERRRTRSEPNRREQDRR